MAFVSLVDEHQLWLKAATGQPTGAARREGSFCEHAITRGARAVLVVEDASRDPLFRNDHRVAGPAHVRFYAGAVLTSRDGYNLGTLCVLDHAARPHPSPKDLDRLRLLAEIVVDEMERARSDQSLREKNRLLTLAESMSGVGRWRYDVRSGRLDWSDEVYRIYGLDPASPASDLAEALAQYVEGDREKLEAVFRRALRDGVGYDIAVKLRRRDGQIRTVAAKASCEVDPQGQVMSVIGVFQDITDQTTYTERLRAACAEANELAERARMAERLAGLGHWRVDAATHAVSWSEQMYSLYGLAEGAELELAAVMAMTHPDDVAEGRERFAAALDGAWFPKESLTRIVRPSGEIRRLSSMMTMERGEAGEIKAVIGTLMDITDQTRTTAAIAESERRYRQLADSVHDVIIQSDLEGRMTYVSPSALHLTGYTPEELVGRQVLDLLAADDAVAILRAVQDQIASRGQQPAEAVECRLTRKDGRSVWLEARPAIACDPLTGRITGISDVVRDITDRKRLEVELRDALEAAQAASAVKSEFLANMSHELRTPLTSIIGFSGLTKAVPGLPEDARRYVERVDIASRALFCLVNDILDFSKVEAGQIVITPSAVDIAALAGATLDLFTPQASAKGIGLELDVAGCAEVCVLLDPDRIRQVLLNLVGNAVKFTDRGSVTLRARFDPVDERLEIDIVDTGEGVAPEKLGRLFQRFSQIDGSLTRSHGGTGLGLAISKGLVEAMGGEIGVESTQGQGSRFWFALHARHVASAVAALCGSDAPGAGLADLRVLIADDHPANRELARLFLEAGGAEISEAGDGHEAVRMARARPYDIILMDVRMPGLDGLGALRQIRSRSGPNDATPILAFTANASADESALLLSQGFARVIAKPVQPAALIGAVLAAAEAQDAAPEGLHHAG